MKILGTIQNELDAVNKKYVDDIIGGLNLGNLSTKDSLSFAEITSKPTTLSGYGIGDAVIWDTNMNDADVQYTHHLGYGYPSGGWYGTGPAMSFGTTGYYAQIQAINDINTPYLYFRPTVNGTQGEWFRFIFDKGNYEIDSWNYTCGGQNVLHRNPNDPIVYFNYGAATNENSTLYIYSYETPKLVIGGVGHSLVHGGNIAELSDFAYRGSRTNDTDFNTLTQSGYYLNTTSSGTGNSNAPIGDGVLVVFDGKYFVPQLHFDYDGQLRTRTKWGSNWQDWRILLDDKNYTSYVYSKTESDSKYLERKSYFMMPTNGFDNGPKLEVSYLSNALYAAGQRFNIEHSGFAIFSIPNLTNENYEETAAKVAAGTTATFTISNNGANIIEGYPYGDIYLSFYYNYTPASVTVEVYSTYEPHGVGWHTLNLVETRGEQNGVYRFYQGFYNITHLRVTITASATTSADLTEIGWLLNRGSLRNFPAVTKFNVPQALYGEMTFINKVVMDNTLKVKGNTTIDKDLTVAGHFFGSESTSLYNIKSIIGFTPSGSSYPRWQMLTNADGLFFQAASYDGTSANGRIVFSGANTQAARNITFEAESLIFTGTPTFSGAIATFNNTAKVTGAAQTPLFVAATSNVGSFIAFTDVGNGTLGSLGVSADRKPTFITYSGGTYELLHKNNLDSCNVSINFYELAEYHDADLSQTDLNGYGLTSSVISNLKAGKYNKVLDTSNTQVWDYTVDGDKMCFKCCSREVVITKNSDGTWYIEFL